MSCTDTCCETETETTGEAGSLVVAYEADWASVKALGARCEEEGIETHLGPCPGKT